MFFKRRKDPLASTETTPKSRLEERRKYYRRGRVKSYPLVVTVQTPDGKTFTGEFVDLSIGGAAARFHIAKDPALATDQVVQLTIGSPIRAEKVTTPANMIYGRQDGDCHLRYGFQFINIGDLYSQLDAFYARFFNRRRSMRVLPPLDCKIPITFTWDKETLTAFIHNISVSGISVALSVETAFRLRDVKEVGVKFQLPGMQETLEGRAWIRHRTEAPGRIVLGLEFDLEQSSGLQQHCNRLSEYVLRRSEEIAMWQEAWA